MKVNKNVVDSIVDNANWELLGFKVNKSAEKVVSESTETPSENAPTKHVCPLCESELEAEISEEQILEHAAAMLEVFEAVEETAAEMLNEEEQELEEDEDEEDEDGGEDEEVEEVEEEEE